VLLVDDALGWTPPSGRGNEKNEREKQDELSVWRSVVLADSARLDCKILNWIPLALPLPFPLPPPTAHFAISIPFNGPLSSVVLTKRQVLRLRVCV